MNGYDTIHIDCECSSFDHSIRFVVDQTTGDFWVSTRLVCTLPWYRRVWMALGYIFQPGRSSQGQYEETHVSHNDFDRLRAMLNLAEQYRQDSCADRLSPCEVTPV